MDSRIVKTKRDIRNALVELLKEIPFEKVTIKLVSEKAMVARPTFYAHYNTVQDILIDYLQDLYETASSTIDKYDLSIENLQNYFIWTRKLREIIDLLYKNNLEGIIYKLNRKYIYDKDLLRPDAIKELDKNDPLYKKFVEVMGGILFAQVISLVERHWNINDLEMAENAYKSCEYILNELIRRQNSFII